MIVIVLENLLCINWETLRKYGGFNDDIQFVKHLLALEDKRQNDYNVPSPEIPMGHSEDDSLDTAQEKENEFPTVQEHVEAPKEEPCDSYEETSTSDQPVDLLTPDKKPQKRIIQFSKKKINEVILSNNDVIPPQSDVIVAQNGRIEDEIETLNETAAFSEDDFKEREFIRCYWCPLCPFFNTKRTAVGKHLESHDESTSGSALTPGKCNICSQTVEHSLAHHKESLHVKSTYKCSECGYHSRTNTDVYKHDCDFSIAETVGTNFRFVFSKGFACLDCPKTFRRFAKVVLHYKLEHLKMIVKSPSFVCHLCGSKLKTFSSYNLHIKLSHTPCHKYKPRKRPKFNFFNRQRSFSCDICSKTFLSSYMLKRHIMGIHEVPSPCDKCGKNFETRVAYRNHYYHHHNDYRVRKRPSLCSICGLCFTHRASMKKHELVVHSSDKKPKKVGTAQCNSCGNYLVSKYGLKEHQQKHCANRKALLNGKDSQP